MISRLAAYQRKVGWGTLTEKSSKTAVSEVRLSSLFPSLHPALLLIVLLYSSYIVVLQ